MMLDEGGKAHAELAPSAAERWTRCPGSVRLYRGLGPDPGSAAARAGTLRHTMLDPYLRHGAIPWELHQSDPDAAADAIYAAMCIKQWVGHYLPDLTGSRAYIEHQVHTDVNNYWGTTDYAVWSPKYRTLLIADAKFGKVIVDAKDNRQLLSYMTGILRSVPETAAVERIVLGVAQPTRQREGYRMSTMDLEAWEAFTHAAWLERRARAANDPAAPIVPGRVQCEYCRARDVCPVFQGKLIASLPDVDDDDAHAFD